MARPAMRGLAVLLGFALLWGPIGCNTGGRGGRLSFGGAQFELAQDNVFLITGEMHETRYMQTASMLQTGEVLISGGTDGSIDAINSAELYSLNVYVPERPEADADLYTPRGGFIDTDFRGDPLEMRDARYMHTSNSLNDGRIVVIGGAQDWQDGLPLDNAEVFDPQKRAFTPVDGRMDHGIFRHATEMLQNDRIMIAGGQRRSETTDDQNSMFIPGWGGFIGGQTQPRFESSRECMIFDINAREAEDRFQMAMDANRFPLELTSTMGQTSLIGIRVSGFDNMRNTGDDLIVWLGGWDTFPGEMAPANKNPQATPVTAVSYYIISRNMMVSGSADITPREIFIAGVNLGEFIRFSPRGDDGVGNLILLVSGYGTGCSSPPPPPEILQVIPSPFGMANFAFHNDSYAAEVMESMIDQVPLICPACDLYYCGYESKSVATRIMTPVVNLIRNVIFGGSLLTAGWAFTVGGSGGMGYDPVGVFFDPFYTVLNSTPALDDAGPYIIPGEYDVTGCWLITDTFIPSNNLESELGFKGLQVPAFMVEIYDLGVPVPYYPGTLLGTQPGDPLAPPGDGDNNPDHLTGLALLNRERSWHTLNRIPGADGAVNTVKDWVLIAGGMGAAGFSQTSGGTVSGFGRPVKPSAEVYVPPRANKAAF